MYIHFWRQHVLEPCWDDSLSLPPQFMYIQWHKTNASNFSSFIQSLLVSPLLAPSKKSYLPWEPQTCSQNTDKFLLNWRWNENGFPVDMRGRFTNMRPNVRKILEMSCTHLLSFEEMFCVGSASAVWMCASGNFELEVYGCVCCGKEIVYCMGLL